MNPVDVLLSDPCSEYVMTYPFPKPSELIVFDPPPHPPRPSPTQHVLSVEEDADHKFNIAWKGSQMSSLIYFIFHTKCLDK